MRTAGFVPAVLYGKGQESLALQVPNKEFEKTLKQAGESTLVYLNVDLPAGKAGSQSYPTIIHEVARDPLSDRVIHADFYKVRLDEKIKTNVPVVFEGEAPAVRDLLGIFVRNVNELEVEAFPQDLPHEIKVNISRLAKFGDQVFARDLDLGPKVRILAESEEIIATVQEPKSEEELAAELAEPTADVSAVEEIKKEEKEEKEGTEAPAEEGRAAPAPAPESKEGKENKESKK